MGGVLSDALGANAVVKSFGAESREDVRLGPSRGEMVHAAPGEPGSGTSEQHGPTCTALDSSYCRDGHGALALVEGSCDARRITYVLTTYFVVHGYLRDIGQHIHQLQRAVNEMEEMVQLYSEPFGVADAPDAGPLHITSGEVRFEHVTFRYLAKPRPFIGI